MSELSELMRSYGVTSMEVPTYQGVAKPTEPTDKTSTTYDADKTAYDASLANYNADLDKFKQYKSDFQNRIDTTPQYLDSQFLTMGKPIPSKLPPSVEKDGKSIRWFDEPATTASSTSQKGPTQEAIDALKAVSGKYDASEADVKGLMTKYGMTNKDVYNITGNYYGANMQAPIYSNTVVTPTTNQTASIKDLFTKYLRRDATPADIDYWTRSIRSGKSNDEIAAALDAQYKKDHPETPTTPVTTTPVTTTPDTSLTDLAAKYDPTIKDAFTKSLHRDASAGDLAYWEDQMKNNSGVTSDWLNKQFADQYAAQQPAVATVPEVIDYGHARGGLIKNYAFGGLNELTDKYDVSEPANPADLPTVMPQAPAAPQAPAVTPQAPAAPSMGTYSLSPSDVLTTGTEPGNARGGLIKNYARGGLNDLTDKYDVSEPANPTDLPTIDLPIQLAQNTAAPSMNDAGMNPPAAPVIAPEAPAAVGAPVENRPAAIVVPQSPSQRLEELFSKYAGSGSGYKEDIKTASAKAKAETEAFQKRIADAMKGDEETMPSKSEMYFRLAAALASPTKTRNGFMENVGMAAKEMADYQKSVTEAKRANRDKNLQLGLKGQELSMQAAKEELATLRGLDTQEAQDRRAILKAQIEHEMKSGEPESVEGKRARDEGFKPGTPEYYARVKELTALSPQNAEELRKISEARLALAQEDALRKIELDKRKEAELTPLEGKLLVGTEDSVTTKTKAIVQLKEALSLSRNAFTAAPLDKVQRLSEEALNSDSKRVQDTRAMENLLKLEALTKLKSTFPGAISDKESAIMLQLQGIDAKSVAERNKIIVNAIEELEKGIGTDKQRLDKIRNRHYKDRVSEKDGQLIF